MLEGKTNSILFRRIRKEKWIIVMTILVTTAILAACSPRTGSGVLKFFFDGVPGKSETDSATAEAAADTLKKNIPITIQPVNPDIYYHPPYKERACTKCHTGDVPGKKTDSQDEVCYTCHADYQKKYSFIHGPVAGGFCTECHSPHFNTNKKLLLRLGQDMCLTCHTKVQVMKNEAHADIGKAACTECHNPHGGTDRYLLN